MPSDDSVSTHDPTMDPDQYRGIYTSIEVFGHMEDRHLRNDTLQSMSKTILRAASTGILARANGNNYNVGDITKANKKRIKRVDYRTA